MLAWTVGARKRRSVRVTQAVPQPVTSQKQTDDEPLFVEITPEIASHLLVIRQHMPEGEEEPTVEELVAIAVSYFSSRLEHDGTQILSKEESQKKINAREQLSEGP